MTIPYHMENNGSLDNSTYPKTMQALISQLQPLRPKDTNAIPES